jgi:hypothetical protein
MAQQVPSKKENFSFTVLKDLRSTHAEIKGLLTLQAEFDGVVATFRAEKAQLLAENTMLKKRHEEHKYLLNSRNRDKVEWNHRLRALEAKQSSIKEQSVLFTSRFFSFSPRKFGS